MMGLTVALDDNKSAQGLLYWDDGTTIGKCEQSKTSQTHRAFEKINIRILRCQIFTAKILLPISVCIREIA